MKFGKFQVSDETLCKYIDIHMVVVCVLSFLIVLFAFLDFFVPSFPLSQDFLVKSFLVLVVSMIPLFFVCDASDRANAHWYQLHVQIRKSGLYTDNGNWTDTSL